MDERRVDQAVACAGACGEAASVGELATVRLGAQPRQRVGSLAVARQPEHLMSRRKQLANNC